MERHIQIDSLVQIFTSNKFVTIGRRATFRIFALLILFALFSGCNSTTTIGDLLTGGPAQLSGDPEQSGLVLVEIEFVVPQGEKIISNDASLFLAEASLTNIDTGKIVKWTDERWGYGVFAGIEPGHYQLNMSNQNVTTIKTNDPYPRDPEKYKRLYQYNAGNTWQTPIIVKAGEPIYRGDRIYPQDKGVDEGLISIQLLPKDNDGKEMEVEENATEMVSIIKQPALERKAWESYFLKVYPNSSWNPRVKQRLRELK